MAIIPSSLARVSNTLRTRVTTEALSSTQAQLLKVQNQLTTMKNISTPSEDPGSASIIMQLQKTLEGRQAYLSNISTASSQLSQVDTTVGSVSDLLQQAQSLASSSVGSTTTPDERAGNVEVLKSIYTQMLNLANQQSNGTYLFGGDKSNTAPFVEVAGGMRFNGSDGQLSGAFDDSSPSVFTVGASDVFGQVAGRVAGTATLAPKVTNATRLADLAGATGNGVRLGSVVLSDGTTSKTIDLTGADSVGDVITRINNAGVGNITAAVDATGTSIELTTTGADNITVSEVGSGSTASDLGILRNVGLGAGAALTGLAVGPRLTPFTPLAGINGGTLDLSSGMTITNGAQTATLSFSTDTTIQDVLNRINGSNTGVRAEINAAGTGIDVVNLVQGPALSISENGGLTAASFGVRTFTPATALASLNSGTGVRVATGADFRITQLDGTKIDVDLSGATTVADALAAINAAASAAGSGLTASFATTGNGIVITDPSTGPGATSVSSLNGSFAAQDLGLTSPGVGGVVTGKDVNPVYASGVFAHLASLRDAMASNDQAAMTSAATALQADYNRAVLAHGMTGAKVQDLETRQTRLEDQNLATKTALANLQDVDMADAITRFQTLQTALQASLQAAGKTLNLSLMDFLS